MEIKNLAIRNESFGEIPRKSLAQEMKDMTLPLLVLIVEKRNETLKSCSITNGSFQRVCTIKEDYASPTPDVFPFKHACGIISKESRDAATTDLPGFSCRKRRQRASNPEHYWSSSTFFG